MCKTKKVQGNDAFHRMNYLYQVSKIVADKNPELSSYYGNLIVNIAKKNVLKLHPEIKKQLCKQCHSVLVSNVSSEVKIKTHKAQRVKCLLYKCKFCANKRRIPVPRHHKKIWIENPDAVVEVIVSN